MGLDTPDNNWDHLYPDFRNRLHALFADVAQEGLQMRMVEGYRSRDRQHWLYGQGRPGDPYYHPGPIVTYKREPNWHGAGMAADCYPVRNGKIQFEFTESELKIFRAGMGRHGLMPTQMKGDYGHVQLDTGEATRQQGLAWVQAGFQDPTPQSLPVTVTVNGEVIEKAGAYLDTDDRTRGWVRPIAEAIGADITDIQEAAIELTRKGVSKTFAAEIHQGRGFIHLGELDQLPGVVVAWDGPGRTVVIKSQ